jgi:hypothetical protein
VRVVVFSNRRLGASAELFVSKSVAIAMLHEVASAAGPWASGRWELELVRWLEQRAERVAQSLDVSEIAWTPDHFSIQRAFLIDAIRRAAALSEHASALLHWAAMIEQHPRESVQFGRRWHWALSG